MIKTKNCQNIYTDEDVVCSEVKSHPMTLKCECAGAEPSLTLVSGLSLRSIFMFGLTKMQWPCFIIFTVNH